MWQLTAESILLSLLGGIGGVALGYLGLPALLAIAPADLPRSNGIGVNWIVLGFSFGLCLLTTVGCGVLPAWRAVRRQASLSSPAIRGLRASLVAVQFSLAIMLLTGAGLFLRSFMLLNAVDRGFDAANLLTARVSLPVERYKDRARGQAFFDDALQRVEALPGIIAAATGEAVLNPFRGNSPNQHLIVEGLSFDDKPALHARSIVSEGYFRTLGIPLLTGRLFTRTDTENSPPVAVISKTMARRYWGSRVAVGRRFKQVIPGMNGEWLTVIGVVGDVVYNRDGMVVPVFYRPASQFYTTERELVVRTRSDPRTLAAAVRRCVQSIDPALPGIPIGTVADRLAEQDRLVRFQATLIALFACLAVVLAATGLYGLIAYSIEQRTREMGIRVALGSTRAGVISRVLKQATAWAGIGMGAGILGALLFERGLAASLYGVTPGDPLTLLAVTATLAAVIGFAAAVPAFRASHIDPAAALRHD